jgi:hypothetical protein
MNCITIRDPHELSFITLLLIAIIQGCNFSEESIIILSYHENNDRETAIAANASKFRMNKKDQKRQEHNAGPLKIK